MPPETDELCQHRDAQVSFAARDLADVVRRALRAPEGSSKQARLLAQVEDAKRNIVETRQFIEGAGPRCGFCTERERVTNSELSRPSEKRETDGKDAQHAPAAAVRSL